MMTLALSTTEQDVLAGADPDQRDAAFSLDRHFRSVVPPVIAALRSLAAELRTSYGGLKTVYYAWRKEGVLACLDHRFCPELWSGNAERRIPREALDFWLSLQLEHQRDTSLRACHRRFMRLWQAGQVPGLPADCEVHPTTGKPHGCDYPNLRRHQLTKYQAKAVRIGKHSASALLPKVLTTRIHLRAGQLVEFDDQDHDVQVAFVGVNSKLTRPSGFHALDLLSGCDTLQSFKPTVLNPDGTRQKLRQIDFEWFVVAYLTQIGYRADTGTTFTWELGTTKTGSAFLERMQRATGGLIEVRDSGLHREPALAGLFHGAAKGNPRMKGSRECWFRLFREECSALPAPTGKDRQHAPEGQAALEREARMLLAAMRALPPHRAELLQLPCLTWTQYVAAVQDIVRIINGRTWHTLEGYEELNFVTADWRFSLESPWLPQSKYLALPDAQKQLFAAMLAQQPELWSTRRLSPAEVWEPRKAELTRVSGSAVPLLFGPEHAKRERVEDDLSIVVQDQEISPTPLVYDAVLTNGRHLTRRQKLAVYLNPFAPDQLEVCDENLRWLGTAPRVQRACKMDTEAAHRRYGFARKVEAQELAPIARLGARITQRETERKLNNARLLNSEPSPEETKNERSAVRFGAALRQSEPAPPPVEEAGDVEIWADPATASQPGAPASEIWPDLPEETSTSEDIEKW